MKFTDGNWMMQKGVRVFYPAQVYSAVKHEDELTIIASKEVRHRGDTLDGPLLTIRLSSPMEDVLGVNIKHFTGGSDTGPHFPLFAARHGYQPEILLTEEAAVVKSGRAEARISMKGGWEIRYSGDDRVLTRSGPRGIGCVNSESDSSGCSTYLHEQLDLTVSECVYGLGERFTAFVKNGQVVETWNKDGGAGSEQAYKSVPFYLTNRGYAVFVNHSGNVAFEVASEKVSRVQFSVPGQSLEYFVIYGPTPKEVLSKYCTLTGMPALPPAWSFGLWLTTSFTTSYDEATVTSFIEGMADRGLPLHVFHFDCFWMREFHWCDFTWDERVFPDPPGMLKRLKERGLKICVWINPYIAQASSLFDVAKNNHYLLEKPDGSVWQSDQWQAGMGIVDFSNPRACTWFRSKLRSLLEMGVDSFKTDFGERIPTDVRYTDGSDPAKMHNYYAYLYNKTVFDLLTEVRGAGQAVLFARSATACCQKYPVHWGGDCFSNFESMAASLRGGLSLSLSGFGFWSHDIGGFEGTPPVEVYKRWIAFGLLSTHSRLHGSSSYRVPWVYDDEAVEVLRKFTKLKCRLMPYLFGQASLAASTGIPVMRAMMVEFAGDPACDVLDRQYMLGNSLLVAPVFTRKGDVQYYLPPGNWTNLLSGEVVAGPGWKSERHGFLSLPVMIPPNTLLAFGARDDVPDYNYSEGVTFRLYELEDGKIAAAAVPDLAGATVLTARVSRIGDSFTTEVNGTGTWQLEVMGIHTVDSINGGSAADAGSGLLITPNSGAKTLTFTV